MADRKLQTIDGVMYLVTPDGQRYKYADVLAYNNPGYEYDDLGNELPIAMAPPAADAPGVPAKPREYSFGDIRGKMGNETLSAAKAALFSDGTMTRNLLPEEVSQYIPPELGGVADLGLAGLLGLVGGIEKGAGYAAEFIDPAVRVPLEALGVDWPYAPGDSAQQLADDMMGMFEGSGFGPEGRIAASIASQSMPVITRQALKAADAVVDPVIQARMRRNIPSHAFLTHEAQPYGAIGRGVSYGQVGVDARPHLPGAVKLTADQRAALADMPESTWIGSDGTDILQRVIGAETKPTIRGQGVYDGPDGIEANPQFIARSGAAQEDLAATEALRGFIDAQGGTPWTRLGRGEEASLFIPRKVQGPGLLSDIEALQSAGSQYGFDTVYDLGEGYVMRGFGGPVDTSRRARSAILDQTGMRPVATTVEGGYPAFEDAWKRGAVEAAQTLLGYLDEASPQAVAALNASRDVSEAAMARMIRDNNLSGEMGGVNETLQMVRNIVGRGPGWVDRLREYVSRVKAGEIPEQIPRLMRSDEVLPATHFSHEARDVIDPMMAHTNRNIRGAERKLPQPYPKQSYFGVGVGQPGGYVPEGGVGPIRHDVDLRKGGLLDISNGFGDAGAEADKIVSNIRANTKSPMSDAYWDDLRTSYAMQIAKMRGYEGLLNESHPLGSIATSFWPVQVGR